MQINVSSDNVSKEITDLNNGKKILVAGPALSNYKAREIMLPADTDEALNSFGQSELYDAYKLLKDLGIDNIYLSNCYSRSDYIRLADKIMHYDFDYFIPIGLYLSDKFYNPVEDKEQYFVEYFLEQFSAVSSLTTVLITERHASLYKDFDHYITEMNSIETDFLSAFNYNKSDFLLNNGNNLNFIYSNITDIPYGNVLLGALYVKRDYAKYLEPLTGLSTVYDLDYNDMQGLRAMYYKSNYYTGNITVENPLNFKTSNDIYSNALVDDVIKRAIRYIDLDKYKGRLYNQYIAIQIESEVIKALNYLSGKLFKEYTINRVGFQKTDPTSGYVIVDYSFVPYGTLESINVIMGV